MATTRRLAAILTASRAFRRSTAAGLSASDLARAARSSCAFFVSAAALRRSAKPVFLVLFIDDFRSSLTIPYAMAWTRLNSKSSLACPGRPHRRPSGRLSDAVMTSVESCLLPSAEFPVAVLQSQNRTSEHRHPGGEGFHGRPGNDLQLAAA
jgi:hypothetical protein